MALLFFQDLLARGLMHFEWLLHVCQLAFNSTAGRTRNKVKRSSSINSARTRAVFCWQLLLAFAHAPTEKVDEKTAQIGQITV